MIKRVSFRFNNEPVNLLLFRKKNRVTKETMCSVLQNARKKKKKKKKKTDNTR